MFSAALYVPSSAIANVEHETVRLGIARREVDAMGWQQPPRTSDALQTGPEHDVYHDI